MLFIVLGVVYLISGGVMIAGARVVDLARILAIVGMISVVLSQLLGVSVNWLGWIVFAVTIAAAIYATKIRKDARNA